MRLPLLCLTASFLAIAAALPAKAEFTISAYGGIQGALPSKSKVNDPAGTGKWNDTVDWEGKSGKMPPYWGVRGTWWMNDKIGFGLDYTHNKVYADHDTMRDHGVQIMEFTDGLNVITANGYRRFTGAHKWTPYVGAGVGISIPHVEYQSTGGKHTFKYEAAGPAFTWIAGVSYPISQRWDLFGEYKGTYTINKTDLDGGGSWDTNIVTNALNVGVSFNF